VGFGTNGSGKPHGAPQSSTNRAVKEILADAIRFSEEAQGLHDFFPSPLLVSVTEWQEEWRVDGVLW
jgi:hypothetical protein